MSRGQWAWTLAVCAHLSLAVCGALEIDPAEDTPAGELIHEYGFVSGADAGFAFFAPSVASLARVTLTLRDAQGHEWPEDVFGDEGVWGLRSSALFDSLAELSDRLLRGVTASWAGTAFGRHPEAVEVVVDVEMEALPSMEEWRDGQRSTWLHVYSATFHRNEPVTLAER